MGDGEVLCYSILPTGHSVSLAADNVVQEALKRSKLTIPKFDFVVSTGYGRYSVAFSDKKVTEIICHARGANFLLPSVRTIVDIGGQDSKVIALDGDGNVTNFVMNDKCAAGTGRFIEVMANVLEVRLEEMGEVSLTSESPCTVSSTCTIFAESEVVSLRAQGEPRENLIAGIHKAIASRVAVMGKSIGFTKDVAFTGGVAKNVGVKKFLADTIGLEIVIPQEPQIIGALGAAIIARAEATASN